MGNMTCRDVNTTSSTQSCDASQTGATMTYDNKGQLVSWHAPATSSTDSDQFLYDNAGKRVLQRATSNGVVSDTITFDGITDVTLSNGTTSTTKYYTVGGSKVAMRKDGTLSYLLPDLLGSASLAVGANGALQAVALYAPFGRINYSEGTMPTPYNFTGQRIDSLTGLLYYGARYYDPVSGRFTSTDMVETNATGLDTYAYVSDNPVSLSDPSGHCPWCIIGGIAGAIAGAAIDYGSQVYSNYQSGDSNPWGDINWWDVGGSAVGGALIGATLGAAAPAIAAGISAGVAAASAGVDASGIATLAYTAYEFGPTLAADTSAAVDVGATAAADTSAAADAGATAAADTGAAAATTDSTPTPSQEGACSFTPDTPVTTDHGQQTIGTVHQGEKVEAYNPQTRKMEAQPIVHVWVHPDNDLVDLTITYQSPAKQSSSPQVKAATQQDDSTHKENLSHATSEVVHTNKKHPFLTTEKGFVPVADLHVGMHVIRADGSVGIITAWRVVPGSAVMYNLEVAHDHTFTVGTGQWVVHNCAAPAKNIVYRTLYPGEDTTNGIVAKNPDANASVYDHVGYGSEPWYVGDQYISTTKSIDFAKAWAVPENKLVALIDLDSVTSPITDLSTEEAQSASVPGYQYSGLGRKSRIAEEVLITGRINPEAIIDIVSGRSLK